MTIHLLPTEEEFRAAAERLQSEAALGLEQGGRMQAYNIDLYTRAFAAWQPALEKTAIACNGKANGPVLAMMAAFLAGFQAYEVILEMKGKRLV